MLIEKIDLPQSKSDRKYTYRIIIRSTLENSWIGKYSILDSEINQPYNNFLKNAYSLRLENDFIMTQQDFLNYFQVVYVTSLYENNKFISDYFLVQVPENQDKEICLEFNSTEPGMFEFGIEQFDENIKRIDNKKSKLKRQMSLKQQGIEDDDNRSQNRFLHLKYMLIENQKSVK